MTKPIRVAIYARFSTDLQNPKSTADQERECRKHAEREGWTVVDVFQDAALSGAGFANSRTRISVIPGHTFR
ncbi:recombinase family protein [Pararhodobacter oceanensis]|uniref:recombinase family protein n=1 Tax=Pararhodobacter oceanensis TaxID=2172121 RepID=UPI001F0C365C|nr:recombinase family protein [Pararhodobacter oceanensis]